MEKDEKISKKPKSGESRHHRLPINNGCSLRSRHTDTKMAMTKVLTNIEENDINNHQEVDITVNKVNYMKSCAPNIVSQKPVGPNQNQHLKINIRKEKEIKYRIVNLPKIYKRLTLANINSAEEHCLNFDHVINLSDSIIWTTKKNVYDMIMSDNSNQSFKNFKYKMLESVKIIKEAVQKDESVLVCCTAGTNRSVSAIVAYCSLCLGWTIDDTVVYIEKEKSKIYGNTWDTLTNLTFKRYLNLINNL